MSCRDRVALSVALAPVKSSAEERCAPPNTEVKNGVRIDRDIPYIPGGVEAQRLALFRPEPPA